MSGIFVMNEHICTTLVFDILYLQRNCRIRQYTSEYVKKAELVRMLGQRFEARFLKISFSQVLDNGGRDKNLNFFFQKVK